MQTHEKDVQNLQNPQFLVSPPFPPSQENEGLTHAGSYN